jgi:hypothetical protein
VRLITAFGPPTREQAGTPNVHDMASADDVVSTDGFSASLGTEGLVFCFS